MRGWGLGIQTKRGVIYFMVWDCDLWGWAKAIRYIHNVVGLGGVDRNKLVLEKCMVEVLTKRPNSNLSYRFGIGIGELR